jgi:hypothetical protein
MPSQRPVDSGREKAMGNDAKAINDPTPGLPLGAPASVESMDGTADGLAFIGYEAADPSLHAPFWSEALQAAASTRNLR